MVCSTYRAHGTYSIESLADDSFCGQQILEWPSAILSPSGLHLGPEAVDDPLGGRVARGDDEQLCKRRLVRIDVLVVEDPWVDQLLARQISVGVGQKVGIFGGHLRSIEIVDELMGFRHMLGVGRDREI